MDDVRQKKREDLLNKKVLSPDNINDQFSMDFWIYGIGRENIKDLLKHNHKLNFPLTPKGIQFLENFIEIQSNVNR